MFRIPEPQPFHPNNVPEPLGEQKQDEKAVHYRRIADLCRRNPNQKYPLFEGLETRRSAGATIAMLKAGHMGFNPRGAFDAYTYQIGPRDYGVAVWYKN